MHNNNNQKNIDHLKKEQYQSKTSKMIKLYIYKNRVMKITF